MRPEPHKKTSHGKKEARKGRKEGGGGREEDGEGEGGRKGISLLVSSIF